MTDRENIQVDELVRRADALEDSGDIDAAIQVLSGAILEARKEARLYAYRGRLYYLQNEFADAVDDFDSALSLHPRAASTLFFRARAKSMLGDLDAALEDFSLCIDIQPDSADAMYQMGLIHEYRREFGAAVEKFQAAIGVGGEDFRDAKQRTVALASRGVLEPDSDGDGE